MKRSMILLLILPLIVPLMFLGCSGDDGSQGPQGIQGDPGPPGGGVTGAATPESCGVCHASVESIHATTGVAAVGNVGIEEGASLIITFDITVDGVPNNSFVLRRAYVNWDNTARQTVPPTLITSFQRDELYRVEDNGVLTTDVGLGFSAVGGTYTVTIPTAFQIDNATYLIQLKSATSTERPIAVVNWNGDHLRDLVTDTGCASCHGPYPAWSEHFRHYSVGGSECQVCHSRYDRSVNFISRDATGALVDTGTVVSGANLVEYVHGIHNSHNMKEDGTGVYYRTTAPDDDFDEEDRYSIGYPSDMRNCKVCHETPAQLAAAATAPVSYYLCMSCHQSWDGFYNHHENTDPALGPVGVRLPIMTGPLGTIHRPLPPTANCMEATSCHGALPAANEAADFHIDLEASDRHYDSFYGGTDISYDNPDNVTFAITGITKSGDNVTFTWTASKNGAPVDPCNANLANGPVFGDLGAYLAYAKGDDWVNEFVGSSPGQPDRASNLFTSLTTTCAANVATTTGLTIAPGTGYADKVLLAIGGKPINRGTFLIGTTSTPGDYFIRVPSPTYAFNIADGSPATARRNAVLTEKCLKCHRGTLYQHGGDRVDNEQLCVICHNPSSADKNNRRERFQIVNADNTVNTDATYDGKENETYDMRYMLHAIHGIEKRDQPWVVYRSRGVYAFVTPETEPPTGWPLVNGEPVPEILDQPIFGSTNGSTNRHAWIVVHYPKPPSECEACHEEGGYEAPDQTKAVALTVDPGGSNYPDQSDDIVIGPTAAACTACHFTAPVRTHADQFGYRANVTKEEMLLLAQP